MEYTFYNGQPNFLKIDYTQRTFWRASNKMKWIAKKNHHTIETFIEALHVLKLWRMKAKENSKKKLISNNHYESYMTLTTIVGETKLWFLISIVTYSKSTARQHHFQILHKKPNLKEKIAKNVQKPEYHNSKWHPESMGMKTLRALLTVTPHIIRKVLIIYFNRMSGD